VGSGFNPPSSSALKRPPDARGTALAEARAEALIERGVERYAHGDVAAAAALWYEAATLCPHNERAAAYVAWAESRLAAERAAAEAARAAAPTDPEPWAADGASANPEEQTREWAADRWSSRAAPSARTDGSSALADGAPPASDDPWNEPTRTPQEPRKPPPSVGAGYSTRERSMRSFLARAPTRPNLPPLDVPELTEETLERLMRNAAAADPEPIPLGGEGAVIEMEAELPTDVGLERLRVREPSPSDTPVAVLAVPAPIAASGSGPTERRTPGSRLPSNPSATTSWSVANVLLQAARGALARGDLETAFVSAEDAVAAAGGVEQPELVEWTPLLRAIYERQLGEPNRIVRLGQLPAQLDPTSAFLLSRVDGTFSIEDLLDVSGLPRLAASRLIALLLRQGALRVD